jgi:hypothetical protein
VPPAPETLARAGELVAPVTDDSLRAALEKLAQNVLTRSKKDRP